MHDCLELLFKCVIYKFMVVVDILSLNSKFRVCYIMAFCFLFKIRPFMEIQVPNKYLSFGIDFKALVTLVHH